MRQVFLPITYIAMVSASVLYGQRVKSLTTATRGDVDHRMPNDSTSSTAPTSSLTPSLASAKITADFAADQPFLEYLRAALEACDGASQILRHHFGNLHQVDEKFQAGLVSEADKNSEKFIMDLLLSRFPDHAVLGEESGFSSAEVKAVLAPSMTSQPLWIIDPLDGTTNYVHQFPYFCISIGLEINHEIVAAVVDAPMLGLRFYALRGGGAFLNGRRLKSSHRAKLKDALLATGMSGHNSALDQQLALCERVIRDSRGLRRAGSAALDLCMVAQGVFDAYWEKNLSPWDTAAGILIATEAGAVVTTMRGEPYDCRDKSILCSTRAIHGDLISIMGEFNLEIPPAQFFKK